MESSGLDFYYQRAGKVWKVSELIEATKDNPVQCISVEDFIEHDLFWNTPTLKDISRELKQVLDSDYSYPIIIDENNNIIDGVHRIIHANLDGIKEIKAVIIRDEQFPEPCYDEYKAANK